MNIQIVLPRGRTSYAPPNSYVEKLLIDSSGTGRGAYQAQVRYCIDQMWQDYRHLWEPEGIDEHTDDKISVLAVLGNTTEAAVITFAITRYAFPKKLVRSDEDSD